MATLLCGRSWDDTGALLRRLKIHLDGELVAALRPGQSVEVPLAPGVHEIVGKLGWFLRSAPLAVNVSPGDDLLVEASSPFFTNPFCPVVLKVFRRKAQGRTVRQARHHLAIPDWRPPAERGGHLAGAPSYGWLRHRLWVHQRRTLGAPRRG